MEDVQPGRGNEDFLSFVNAEAAAAGAGSLVSQRNLRALYNAIVDSGASGVYVSKGVQLENVQPGRGNVSVANGVREAIAKIGDLGPLKGAQKVNTSSVERSWVCLHWRSSLAVFSLTTSMCS